MTGTVTVSEGVEQLATLVQRGDIKQAKREAAALIDTANPRDLQVIAWCASTLDAYPHTGVDHLRAAWRRTDDEHARAIIAACAPRDELPRQRAVPELELDRVPRWTRRNGYQAPSTVRREVRPELRRRPRRPAREEPAAVAAYHHDRAGIDDAPAHRERPDGYAIDYDRAAVPATTGTLCVSCWIERAASDRATTHDDGLCGDCRERGRDGIAPLPAGSTRADAVTVRCAFLAAHNPPTTARVLIRSEWTRAHPRDRHTIAQWAAARLPNDDTPVAPATPVPPANHGTCDTCGNARTVADIRHQDTDDDGQCRDCRTLDTQPADRETVPA